MKKISVSISFAMISLTSLLFLNSSYAQDKYTASLSEKCIIPIYNNTFQGFGTYHSNTGKQKTYTGSLTIKVTGCNTAMLTLGNGVTFEVVDMKPGYKGEGVVGKTKKDEVSSFGRFYGDKKQGTIIKVAGGGELYFEAELK